MGHAITRRQVAVGAACGAVCALGGFLSSGLTPAQATETDDIAIYQGTAPGFMGALTLNVAVRDGRIEGIWCVENTERHWRQPSQSAVDVLSKRVVEEQSLAVDAVSGATFSSRAFFSAVEDALESGGVDVAPFVAQKPHETKAGQDVDCDVLVIGSGLAGLTAALAAATKDLAYEKSGLSVVMVERAHFVGGSSAASGGGVLSFCDSRANERLDANSDPQALMDEFEGRCGIELNRDLADSMLSVCGDTWNKLFDLGSPFSVARAVKVQWESGPAGVVMRAKEFTTTGRSSQGFVATEYLYTLLREMGVDVRLGADAYELIVEDGAVAGAKVRTYDEEYTVHAKKTVMATGGCARNAQMLEQYASEYAGSMVFCCGGANGDGQAMMLDQGATMRGFGAIAYPGTLSNGIHGKTSLATQSGKGIWVNKNGERFDDGRYLYPGPHGSGPFAKRVNAQEDGVAFNVFDSTADYAAGFDEAMTSENNGGIKAFSIEELAEKMGVPCENLQASIASAAAAVEAGEDAEFGVPVQLLGTMTEPPFYAVEMRCCVLGTECGIDVDSDCRVLDAQGSPIPNLFTCGETMLGNFMSDYYLAGGGSLANCLLSGRLAGEAAKAEIG